MGLLLEGTETAILAICHDMAECIIGDITPHCKVISSPQTLNIRLLQVSEQEKRDREMAAFKDRVSGLPSHVMADLFGSFKR